MSQSKEDQLMHALHGWTSVFLGPKYVKQVPSLLVDKFRQMLLALDPDLQNSTLLEQCAFLKRLAETEPVVIERNLPFNYYMLAFFEGKSSMLSSGSKEQLAKARAALIETDRD